MSIDVCQKRISSVEKTIADLQTKRDQVAAKVETIRSGKRCVALQAKVGDKTAIKTLENLNGDLTRALLDLEDYDLALGQASTQLDAAQHDLVAAQGEFGKQQLADLAARRIRAAENFDNAFENLAECLDEFLRLTLHGIEIRGDCAEKVRQDFDPRLRIEKALARFLRQRRDEIDVDALEPLSHREGLQSLAEAETGVLSQYLRRPTKKKAA